MHCKCSGCQTCLGATLAVVYEGEREVGAEKEGEALVSMIVEFKYVIANRSTFLLY